MEEDDDTPYPRDPPSRSFDQLPTTGIALEADKFASCPVEAPRYCSYDYENEKNSPPWSDEEQFYAWLLASEIPRELAEMLYFHAPEVSFIFGPGHIAGVDYIINGIRRSATSGRPAPLNWPAAQMATQSQLL